MASNLDGSPVTPTPRQRQSGVERPFALHPPGMVLGAGSSQHYRFSDYDEGTFSEGAGVSADQAKRALRAHLAETERRMAEAGRLGTALVQQQRDLTEKLREVEELQAESELSPELKKKLAELEKEYDDVARETARAFLPKQRIPSNESTGSPEGKGGRRSLSPVKYESHASGSPSKLTVSNRKQRNQATNRVHDIEFAAEISTSLISQVRGLQALLAEREEELRDTKQDLAQLEDNSESLRERIKELDESEHRYKEENWNLETRIRDLEAAQRDAADNEKKVAQQLAALAADKTKAQRELDELKASHSRLMDDHTASVKLHDIELGTAKRNMAMADSEKAAMQRKIDELAGQNQELARAVSMQYRARTAENDALPATSDDDFDTATDNVTPDHSPPASPVKGTPRHSVLEMETLKTSLLHSRRTLQSLRTNLHREKTEKLELRRMLQDARDELEHARSDPNASGSGAAKKSRKDVREAHSRLRPGQLGGARSSRTDLYTLASTDPDWEEIHGGETSPSASRARAGRNDLSDQFDTANEAQMSDTSFATARDGAETAEDFHTGAEQLSSSGEDTMTETEKDPSRRRTLLAKAGPSTAEDLDADPANQSTASTSDDDEFSLPRTPTAALTASGGAARMRLRVSRSSLASRRLRHMSSVEEAGGSPGGLRSSPFSATGSPAAIGLASGSTNSTPRAAGAQQSLFAELGELDEDSDDEVASDGTPSRVRSPRIVVPASFGGSVSSETSTMHSPLPRAVHSPSPKIVMVDRATLTDAVTILPWSEEDEKAEQAAAGGDLPGDSRPSSFMSDDAVPIDEKLKQFPSPPTSPPRRLDGFALGSLSAIHAEPTTRSVEAGPDFAQPAQRLSVSDVFSVPIEPVSEPEPAMPTPVVLAVSSVLAEHVPPKMPPSPEPVEPVVFATSMLHIVDITPIELPPPIIPVPVVLPKPAPPALTFSAIQQQGVDPIEEPEPERSVPEPLTVSGFHVQHVVPVSEPEPEPVKAVLLTPPPPPPPVVEPLSISGFHVQHVVPVSEPEPEPVEAALPEPPVVEPLSISGLQAQHVVPVSEPEPEPVETALPVPPVVEPLSISGFQAQHVEPIPEPEVPRSPLPQLSFSTVQGERVAPVSAPEPQAPTMAFSNVFSQHVYPVVPEEPVEVVIPAVVGVSVETQTDEWKPEPAATVVGAAGAAGAVGAVGAAAALLAAASASPASPAIEDESVPRSPKRNGFIIPRDSDPFVVRHDGSPFRGQLTTPKTTAYNSLLGWSKLKGPPTPVIAEDETRQSPSASPLAETPESQRPFKEISVNANAPRTAAIGQGRNAHDDEQGFMPRSATPHSPQSVIRDETLDTTPRVLGMGSKAAVDASTFGPHSRTESQDSATGSVQRPKHAGYMAGSAMDAAHRPRSASSSRLGFNDGFSQPLPLNHRETLEAARTGSAGSLGGEAASSVALGNVGAGVSNWRVRTPTGGWDSTLSTLGGQGATPTPRANNRTVAIGGMRPSSRPGSRTNASHAGGAPGTLSRQTSMSSFASEVDARFQTHDGSDVFGNSQSHTDPRMIQAITQTMIGEYLWKYTRKAGRSGHSENRHRRYFWIHPYTRMLYWSDQGPTPGSRAEQRAKSVVIEGVRVVTDDNPMPPGLHRKSLVVISPGRTIKFTCTTGHRHEVWFNALSYLLLRNDEVAADDGMTANGAPITREDVDEFNPAFGSRTAAGPQAGRRPPVSLSSYNSRTTRNESPVFDFSTNVPTLTPTPKRSRARGKGAVMTPSASAAGLSSRSRLSRIGGYWRSSQSLSAQFNSLRGRNSTIGHRHTHGAMQDSGIYEASAVNDSAEELRVLYEAQDRASDRLENVRACCDGKHDVGMLSHSSRRHRHSHGPAGILSTPTHSTRVQAQNA